MSTYSDEFPDEQSRDARREYMRQYMKDKRKNNSKYNVKNNEKRYKQKLRIRVMEKLGGAKCSVCGCDKIEILEVNHKNGGGNKERKERYGSVSRTTQFYRDIIYDRVDNNNYDIMCKVCNAQHYVEKIKGIHGHIVTWNGSVV